MDVTARGEELCALAARMGARVAAALPGAKPKEPQITVRPEVDALCALVERLEDRIIVLESERADLMAREDELIATVTRVTDALGEIR